MQAFVINLGELPEEGQNFKGALDSEIFGLAEDDAKSLGPLEFDLHAQQFDTELLLRGTLRAPFEFTCVRDLRTFAQTIDLPETAISLEIAGGGEFDATSALREEILINFPEYPHCDEGDVPQACEIDLQYLAVDKPVSDDVESPPAGDGDSRWDVLDTLEGPPEKS